MAIGQSSSEACSREFRKGCATEGVPGWLLLLLFVIAAAIVYLAVSITDIVEEKPGPKPRPQRRRTHPWSEDETVTDRLERAANFTGDRAAHFAWMDPGTLTGKLTLAMWMSRWWASGSYMRRRLLVSIGTALLIAAVIGVIIALL